MSDEQSAPVEPEPLVRPSTDAETGPTPGAADTEVGRSAGFATSAGEPEPTERVPTPAQADGLDQGSTSISTPNGPQPAAMVPNAATVPVWGVLSAPFMPAQAYSISAQARNRALRGTRIGLGYAAIAAVTALLVIAIGSPGPVRVAAVADPAATISPAAAPSPSPSTAGTAPSTSSSASASPTPTVTGHVSSSGIHSGDLRYFLLPPPDGPSSVQGDPDGTTESLNDIVARYGGGSSVRSLLHEYGFKAACDRVYQDSTMGANVSIELLRFSGSSGSSQWLSGYKAVNGAERISVPGVSGAVGWSYQKDDTYVLIGVYRDGDTFFEVSIYGEEPVFPTDLAQVIKSEHARLANG